MRERDMLIETIGIIRTRLDEIASLALASYELSIKNKAVLDDHIRRTEASEKRLAEMEALVQEAMTPLQWFTTTGKIAAWVAGVGGAVAVIYALLRWSTLA